MKYILSTISCFFLYSLIMAQSSPLLNGVFECNKNKYTSSNQTYTANTASAYFNTTAAVKVDPNLGINAGNIKINNTALQLFNGKIYGDVTNAIVLTEQHWVVNGGGSIPSMDFTTTQSFPEFSLYTPVNPLARVIKNDTLYKSDTLYVDLENINYADSLTVSIIDGYGAGNDSLLTNGGTGNNGKVILDFRFPVSGGGSLAIASALLQTLHTGPKAIVIVQAHNTTVQNINSKNYLFRNSYSIGEANIYIKN